MGNPNQEKESSMGDLLGSVAKVVEVFSSKGPVAVNASTQSLGIAYALPRIDGGPQVAVEQYGPWTAYETSVAMKRESLLGFNLIDAKIIIHWKCSSSGQYIYAVRVDPIVELDPTVDFKVDVAFDSPEFFDVDYEAYQLSFELVISYDPVGSDSVQRCRGYIRADGTSWTESLLL